MPRVGNKKFKYTKKGRKAAKDYAKKSCPKGKKTKTPKTRGRGSRGHRV